MLCLDLVVIMIVKTFKYRFRKVKAKSSKHFSVKNCSIKLWNPPPNSFTSHRNNTVHDGSGVVMDRCCYGVWEGRCAGWGEGGVWRHRDFPIGYSDVYVITDNRVPGELRLRLFDAIQTEQVTLFQQLRSCLTLVKIVRW